MSSETSASPEARRARIALRVGSASAAKTELKRSTSLSIAIQLYCHMAMYKSINSPLHRRPKPATFLIHSPATALWDGKDKVLTELSLAGHWSSRASRKLLGFVSTSRLVGSDRDRSHLTSHPEVSHRMAGKLELPPKIYTHRAAYEKYLIVGNANPRNPVHRIMHLRGGFASRFWARAAMRALRSCPKFCDGATWHERGESKTPLPTSRKIPFHFGARAFLLPVCCEPESILVSAQPARV